MLVVAGTISFDGEVGATGASTELFGIGAFTGTSTDGDDAGAGDGVGVGVADDLGVVVGVACGCGLSMVFLSTEYLTSEIISSNNLP